MATQDNSIQSFKFAEGVTVRSTLDENGSPWFVAADVCNALEIRNVSDAMKRLDEDEKTTLSNTEGRAGNGAQAFNIINESGLYSLILTSRKPEAKKFKKWVTSEVLPAIRKNGKYEVASRESAETASLPVAGETRMIITMRDGVPISTKPVPHDAVVATPTFLAQLVAMRGYALIKIEKNPDLMLPV